MDIKHVDGSASLYLLKKPQIKEAAAQTPQQPAGDVVNLSAKGLNPEDSFTSEADVQAYKGVIDAAHTNPSLLAEAHGGLDPERVYRLLGLIE